MKQRLLKCEELSVKIAIIINNSNGLYNFRRELIHRLLIKGHRVIALVPFSDHVDQLEESGVRLIETPMDRRGINPYKDLKLLKLYYKILKYEKPDMVITYTIKPNIYGGLICRLINIPYSASITGLGTAFEKRGILRIIVTALNSIALKDADNIFFENSDNLSTFVNRKIINYKKAVLLHGAGVNLVHFSYQSYPEVTDQTINFLFIGRIMEEKGINELFEAMTILISEGYSCSLDTLGVYEEGYESVINQNVKAGWLRYHGYQLDVRPFISNTHCFVLPSWHEGMANTNLEAAATGRPIITTNIPGCKEAVIDNVSGYLCNVKDVEDLYNKMKKFIELPIGEKIKMGVAGRQHMVEVFNKEKVVDETIKYLFNGGLHETFCDNGCI